MGKIQQLFETLIQRVNKSSDHQKFVQDWVGSHIGKVLQLETDQGAFHVILHRKGTMECQKGTYPSPDVIYKASEKTLMDLFTGQATFRNVMKSWELIVIGAGHESLPLAKLILQVMRSS